MKSRLRPSGWDSENKIAILYENIKSASPCDSFSEVIMKPLVRKVCLIIWIYIITISGCFNDIDLLKEKKHVHYE